MDDVETTTPAARLAESRAWRPHAVFILNLIAQTVIAGVGLLFIFAEDDFSSIGWLASWCALASVYGAVAIAALSLLSRRAPDASWRPSTFQTSRVAHVLTYLLTVLTSLVGLTAAVQVIVFRSDPEIGVFINIVGVWAMLIGWGFLHWNFAQLYLQNFYRSESPTLRFPNKANPNLADFAYFSYTIGTSFAASDVEVQSTRARWGMVWHSVISFFFNSLIIVLAMNVITSIDLTSTP